MPRVRYGPDRRLHRKREYAAAFARGVTVRDPILKVVAIENGLGRTRLGTAVTKRVARRAVDRNRARRRIREAFRAALPLLPAGLDLVVQPLERAGGAAGDPAFKDLVASLLALARRAKEKLEKRAARRPGGAERPRAGEP